MKTAGPRPPKAAPQPETRLEVKLALPFGRITCIVTQMVDEVFGADRFSLLPHLVALAIAYLLAMPIGWNREREERSAGLRTFPLVAVATCGFIQASEHLTAESPEAMARIVEGLITGMGFIGGGAILRQSDSVKGTATAASLWVTGAIGAAVGLGSYDVAVVLAVATVITLWVMEPIKRLGHISPDERERRAAERGAKRKRRVPRP
jgi:putative Mg2+ transporter-C (MgtC) family protein